MSCSALQLLLGHDRCASGQEAALQQEEQEQQSSSRNRSSRAAAEQKQQQSRSSSSSSLAQSCQKLCQALFHSNPSCLPCKQLARTPSIPSVTKSFSSCHIPICIFGSPHQPPLYILTCFKLLEALLCAAIYVDVQALNIYGKIHYLGIKY